MPRPGSMTTLQRWKLRRNLVIYHAHTCGCSQRFLADVFDLPHSRIAAILKEFKTKYGKQDAAKGCEVESAARR